MLVTAYTVFTVVLPDLRSVRRRLIWTAWRAPGKQQVVDGGDLDPADLRAAVADALDSALERDVPPGKRFDLLLKLLLVVLDDHDVVGLAGEEVLGVLALGVQGRW
ncbi:hypothetical protein ABZ725_29030 [Streptomyces sp. NPDC006872]|uniref:hypothetical protein n=1 Tax=Streptomyces sp. NPDC006872 TaxID=3155720 RepID=UPI0033ED6D06